MVSPEKTAAGLQRVVGVANLAKAGSLKGHHRSRVRPDTQPGCICRLPVWLASVPDCEAICDRRRKRSLIAPQAACDLDRFVAL